MLSLDFPSLRRAYAGGELRPTDVAAEILARIAARGDDGVWITRVEPPRLLAAAAAVEEHRAAGAELPLFGLPFAVKDNIDVAGLPTTAACPGFAGTPDQSATVVERLIAAGALLIGKTNLDQFATGLVGTRSPYGIPRNPFDPAYIPGGSSSGSAVAVSAGLASFALGTDTAGSGRVPASFNNIVGLKPTFGLISATGVVPACRSLDCVSIFALTVADAAAVHQAVYAADPGDPYSRPAPAGFAAFGAMPARFAFGVLKGADRDFFGDDEAAALYDRAIGRLAELGGEPTVIDFAPFRDAAALVYRGAWLAERLAAIDEATGGRREKLLPVTREIIAAGGRITAGDVFGDLARLAAARTAVAAVWRQIDLLLVPTAGTIYTIAQIAADAIGLNETLGRYTNFVNPLDLAALAVPSGFRRDGLPVGVTLVAPAFHDPLIAAVGARLHAASGLPLGATGAPQPPLPQHLAGTAFPYLPLAVVGAHLSGEPANGELLALGARLRRPARTSDDYRLYALADGKRPGLVRRAGGAPIEVEIWDLPSAAVGVFLAGIAAPLGLGTITLAGGEQVCGFLCEAEAIGDARDITAYGGWRAWRAVAGHG